MKRQPLIRVSRRQRCPVCEHDNWCSFFADMTAVICMRVKSDKPTKNGGWTHHLAGSPLPRYTSSPHQPKPKREWEALVGKYHERMTDNGFRCLAADLGLSVEVLKDLRVGWDGSKSRYTFPMRNHDGQVVGIRTRAKDGKKAVSGTDGSGLFYVPEKLESAYLVVTEGPSDTAAVIDCGFGSVVGKPSCKQGDNYVIGVIKRLQPRGLVLVPDNDGPGIEGFGLLVAAIANSGAIPLYRVLTALPPIDAPDARAWAKKSRKDLARTIAANIEMVTKRSTEETQND